jgi:hypothetical protein
MRRRSWPSWRPAVEYHIRKMLNLMKRSYNLRALPFFKPGPVRRPVDGVYRPRGTPTGPTLILISAPRAPSDSQSQRLNV